MKVRDISTAWGLAIEEANISHDGRSFSRLTNMTWCERFAFVGSASDKSRGSDRGFVEKVRRRVRRIRPLGAATNAGRESRSQRRCASATGRSPDSFRGHKAAIIQTFGELLRGRSLIGWIGVGWLNRATIISCFIPKARNRSSFSR
jgi:hypothetical protein